MDAKETPLLSVPEFANALGIKPSCIRRWILLRKVTVIKIRVSEDGEEIIVRSLHAAQNLERAKAALRAKRGDDADS